MVHREKGGVTVWKHKIDILKESVKNLGIAAYEGLKEPLKDAAGLASEAISEIAAAFERDGLQGAVDAAGGAMSEVIGEIGKQTPKMVGAAVDLLTAFTEGLWSQRLELAEAAQGVAIAAFEGLGDAVPVIAPLTDSLGFLTKNLKTIAPVAVTATAAVVGFKVIAGTTRLVQGATVAFQLAQVQVSLFAAANGRAAIATAAANGTFKLTEIIVALMTKQMTLGALAAAGFKTAMATLGGPIGLALLALTTVTAGIAAYKAMAGQGEGATQSLSSRMGDLNAKLAEQTAAQADLATSRGEALASAAAESDRVQSYVNELRLLQDAQGGVKDADKARADQLAELINTSIPGAVEALSTEEGAHYKISESIDAEIFSMRKRMALQAMEEEYNDALKNRVKTQQDYAEALRIQEEAQGELDAAIEKNADSLNGAYVGAVDAAREKLEQATQGVETAEGSMTRYQDVLSAFDTALASESVEELDAVILKLSSNIVKSTGENQSELKKAADDTRDTYARMKQYNEDHWNTWNETERKSRADSLAGLKTLMEEQEKELEAASVSSYNEGKAVPEGFAKGMRETAWMVSAASLEVACIPSATTRKILNINSPSKDFISIGLSVTEGFSLGMTRGKDEVIKTAEDLSKAVLDASTDWIEERRFYQDLSAENELAFWEELRNNAGLQAKELAKIDRNIYKAREGTSKEAFENSKRWIEQERFYKRLSAEEEVEAWERVTARKNLLTDQQLDAEKSLFTARQTLLKEQSDTEKKLLDEQTKRVDEYEKNIASRVDGLRSFAGLFSEVDKKTEVSGQALLKNLEDQVQLFKGWQADMEKLAGSEGMSDALLAELREMGPKAAAQIHALSGMTKDQLGDYVKNYTELGAMIQTQAESEIPPIKIPITLDAKELEPDGAGTGGLAQSLAKVGARLLEALRGGAKGADAALELPVKAGVVSQEEASKAISQSVTAMCAAVETNAERLQKSTETVVDSMVAAVRSKYLGFLGAGMHVMNGLNTGLIIQGQVAIQSARRIADEILSEMQRALDINSPSRKMRDLVGKPAAQGFLVGFEDEMARFHSLAQESIDRETAKINTQVSAQVNAKQRAQGLTREVHNNTNTIEKVVGLEAPEGLSGELFRYMNLKLKAEERRVGASFA